VEKTVRNKQFLGLNFRILVACRRDGIEEQCAHEKALTLSAALGSQRQTTGFQELKWSNEVEYLSYMKGKSWSHVPPRSKALHQHKSPSTEAYGYLLTLLSRKFTDFFMNDHGDANCI
jgi:hypothetical protein